MSGADRRRAPVVDDVDADDPAVLDQQVGQLGLVVHRHAGFGQALVCSPMARALPMAYIFRPRRMLQSRVSITLSMVSGPRRVRRPRLIFRKSACVTIRLAGAFVYAGCSRSSSLPSDPGVHRHRLDAAAAEPPARRLGVVVGVLRHPGEAERGVLAEELHDLRTTVEEAVGADLGHVVADDAR